MLQVYMYMDVQVYSSLNQFNTQKSKLFLLKAEEAFHISHDKEELLQNTLSFGSFLNIQFFQGSGSQRKGTPGNIWRHHCCRDRAIGICCLEARDVAKRSTRRRTAARHRGSGLESHPRVPRWETLV